MRGPCLETTLKTNGRFTVTPAPEYKYCKILKAASKLRLDVLMVQETHVNGLVDLRVRDVEQGAAHYGFSVIWLHARTYLKGAIMVLLRDDIQVESQGPLPFLIFWWTAPKCMPRQTGRRYAGKQGLGST